MERYHLGPEKGLSARWASRAARKAFNHTRFEHPPSMLQNAARISMGQIGRFLSRLTVRPMPDLSTAEPSCIDPDRYRRLDLATAASDIDASNCERCPLVSGLGDETGYPADATTGSITMPSAAENPTNTQVADSIPSPDGASTNPVFP